LFTIPVLGELIVSLRRPIFFDRTLIWLTIPLFLLLAAGIAQLRFNAFIFIALGILATTSVFSTGDYYRYTQKEDWKSPAGYVGSRADQNDLILFNSPMVQLPFDYYFRDYETKNYLQVVKHGVPDMFENGHPERRITDSDIPRLLSLLKGHNRVWLVYSHDSYTDPTGLVPKTLAGKMKLMETRDFYGGQVQFYATP
jgi:hypothetical protein